MTLTTIRAGHKATAKEWRIKAAQVALELAKSCRFFTVDDVWIHLETPAEPRALGSVLRKLKTEGVIKKTGVFVSSRRAECHGRPIMRWESLICKDFKGSAER